MRRENSGIKTDFQETKAKLAEDLRLVAEDAEELMKVAGGELGERTREVRERLSAALDNAKTRCAELSEQAEEGLRVADRSIRANPYRSVGIALSAGLLLGFLLKRRS